MPMTCCAFSTWEEIECPTKPRAIGGEKGADQSLGREALVGKKPMDVAREFGEQLPSFASLAEASRHYERYTQAGIQALEGLTPSLPGFAMDYSPDSLKSIEEIYFNLAETAGFAGLGLTQQAFESLIGVYFAAVVTRNDPKARLVVQEF